MAVESVTCAPYSEYAGALGWAVYTVDAWNRRDQSGQSGSVSRPRGPPGARDAAVIGRAAALGWGSGAGGRETVELRDRGDGGRAGGGRGTHNVTAHTRTSRDVMNSYNSLMNSFITFHD